MYRLTQKEGIIGQLKKHQQQILFSMKDADVSVRKRALDLLFVICDKENALNVLFICIILKWIVK